MFSLPVYLKLGYWDCVHVHDFIFEGKPNIISIWAENKAGLVNKITSGSVIIDTTPPSQGVVNCPQFIGVSITV